jgi:hypothetical protein
MMPEEPLTPVDDDGGRYTVAGFSGVAFYLAGRSQRWEAYRYWADDPDGPEDPETGERGYWADDDYEGEWCDDPDGQLWAVMVGDDAFHPVERADLSPLGDDDYCAGCGQVGCGW